MGKFRSFYTITDILLLVNCLNGGIVLESMVWKRSRNTKGKAQPMENMVT
jgi:hypothetical protein